MITGLSYEKAVGTHCQKKRYADRPAWKFSWRPGFSLVAGVTSFSPADKRLEM